MPSDDQLWQKLQRLNAEFSRCEYSWNLFRHSYAEMSSEQQQTISEGVKKAAWRQGFYHVHGTLFNDTILSISNMTDNSSDAITIITLTNEANQLFGQRKPVLMSDIYECRKLLLSSSELANIRRHRMEYVAHTLTEAKIIESPDTDSVDVTIGRIFSIVEKLHKVLMKGCPPREHLSKEIGDNAAAFWRCFTETTQTAEPKPPTHKDKKETQCSHI